MRRSDHPSRPKATTCCFFSSFKTLLTTTGGIALASTQRPECWIIVGRFSGDYVWPVLGDHRGKQHNTNYSYCLFHGQSKLSRTRYFKTVEKRADGVRKDAWRRVRRF